jgi:hypothetical protein
MAEAQADTDELRRARERNCAHGDLWLARNGWWYCVSCEPPISVYEVLDRRQEHEELLLFDGADAA